MRRLYSLGTFEQSISALVQMLDKLQEDVYKDVRQLASVRIKNQLGQIQIIMDFLTTTTDSWKLYIPQQHHVFWCGAPEKDKHSTERL